MEAAASKMLSSSLSLPPRTQLKQSPHPPSALKLYEPANSSMLATSLPQHFPTSVLIQEQRPESKPLLQTVKEDKISLETVENGDIEAQFSTHEVDADQYLQEFQGQFLQLPGLWLPTSDTKEKPLSSSTMQPMDVEMKQVLALAKKALSASKKAASLLDNDESLGVDHDNCITSSLGATNSSQLQTKKVKFVKSTRLLERQSKRRKGSKSNVIVRETNTMTKPESHKSPG